ncbi:hypothetical protein FHS18_005541 [Paenibacillus phyllosphaerae]|uniref:Uncharacterized protein n=1 Tax=Paenibacillus phyllosphaerae TaxID=274593 RepID=A0A7W5FQW0_9BACL|nr:hypothetical protein [Paenibacillus phyllosphaerae]
MHLMTVAWTIMAVWRWGDRKHWKNYYPTMLYVALCAALYLFVYGEDKLWNFRGSLLNDKLNELPTCWSFIRGAP